MLIRSFLDNNCPQRAAALSYYFVFALFPIVFVVSASVNQAGNLTGSTEIFQSFTLDNGLRVIVHTDRKAPIVGVAVPPLPSSAKRR